MMSQESEIRLTNYDIVQKSYKKILKKNFEKHLGHDTTKIYNEILKDLDWDNSKRPMIRQLVGRYKKEQLVNLTKDKKDDEVGKKT